VHDCMGSRPHVHITRDTPCANDLAPRMSSLVPWPLPLSSLSLLELDRSQNWVGGGNELSAHRYFSTFLIHVSWEPDQYYHVKMALLVSSSW